jgi:ribosome-associated protein
MGKTIIITNSVGIPQEELFFKASRSSGPGGQNVNKLNTKITLFFNIKESESFSDSQKNLISDRLSSRIDKEGFIRIVSRKHRTQKANRIAAIERLQNLLSDAIITRPLRIKTKIPYSKKQKRLDDKKRRGYLKKQRADRDFEF